MGKSCEDKKVSFTSTSTPQQITIGSQALALVSHDQSTPSVQAEAATNDSQNQMAREIEMPEPIEPDVASNEPMVASTEEPQSSEPSRLSPIRDGAESEYESDDEAIYDIDSLIRDPGKRVPISAYDVNERNSVIRGYIALGPCQPRSHNFPRRKIGGKPRRFVAAWFDEFSWLEYSVELDAAFCFRDIINCCAKETTNLIMEDLGCEYFAILADESSDVYQKEQLALCLRYVDKKGKVVERFLGVIHVENTTSLTLKAAIQSLLIDHALSLSMVRGQGYDGASNMKGHANGLKKLIMDESPSAYYVHCFAHQLQLTLVSVAKENIECSWFFDQQLREEKGWNEFLNEVHSFCMKYGVKIPNMEGLYRDKRFYLKITNQHRYHVDMFLSVIDRQLRELNDRFDEVNTELLLCMASFNPIDSFAAYDKANLVKLAQFYPDDFSRFEMDHLSCQLQLFITDMRGDERFRKVKSIAELSIMLVETKKHTKYDVVYKLLKLVLILPVATASVERILDRHASQARLGE
ncbi:hypothetical protein U9M48_005128 [Paspalum notatum var. saurae]|uniref:DUF4371 domain-containing protein n=1 Tax=Paspalum notatum var. saurae TaxID=547442 RepID=A0AAQ3PRI1_PASNO